MEMHADFVIKDGFHLSLLSEMKNAEKNKYLKFANVKDKTGYFCGGKVVGKKIYPDDSHTDHPF